MGLDLRDLIRNIHPLHHFAEYRIAKVALAMVEEGVIRSTCGSPFAAMAGENAEIAKTAAIAASVDLSMEIP